MHGVRVRRAPRRTCPSDSLRARQEAPGGSAGPVRPRLAALGADSAPRRWRRARHRLPAEEGGGVIRNAASPVGEHGLSRSSGRARLAEPRPSHGMAQVKTPTTPARAHRAGPPLTRSSRPMGSGALAR